MGSVRSHPPGAGRTDNPPPHGAPVARSYLEQPAPRHQLGSLRRRNGGACCARAAARIVRTERTMNRVVARDHAQVRIVPVCQHRPQFGAGEDGRQVRWRAGSPLTGTATGSSRTER